MNELAMRDASDNSSTFHASHIAVLSLVSACPIELNQYIFSPESGPVPRSASLKTPKLSIIRHVATYLESHKQRGCSGILASEVKT